MLRTGQRFSRGLYVRRCDRCSVLSMSPTEARVTRIVIDATAPITGQNRTRW